MRTNQMSSATLRSHADVQNGNQIIGFLQSLDLLENRRHDQTFDERLKLNPQAA
jgi:hypothetical protein